MAGIYSIGGSAGHRYAGWLSEVEAKNFTFGGKVFNGSPSAIYVGSNLVLTYWLKYAAMNAIYGAFGQRDGMSVIKATNAYLNQLAASDRDKATALAGFINEDPMMVCSLGLEVEGVTMPIRLLQATGNAYINTGITKSTTGIYQLRLQFYRSTGLNKSVFGAQNVGRSLIMFADTNNRLYMTTGGSGASSSSVSVGLSENTMYDITVTDNGDTKKISAIDNNTGSALGSTYSYSGSIATIPMTIYNNNGQNQYWNDPVGVMKLDKDGENLQEMYPFIRKINDVNKVGMLDITHDILYQNAGSGSFSIGYKIYQNGSWVTWTPLNQQ